VRKKRLLVFARREIFHKFTTLRAPGLDVVLADVSEYGCFADEMASFDLIFLRTKDEELLEALQAIEVTSVLDRPEAVAFSLDRYRVLKAAAEAGVRVPEQLLQGETALWPVVGKNRIDRGDNLPAKLSPEAWEAGEYPYAQRYLESEWEYKVYQFGRASWFFRQKPALFYPDKLTTREAIEPFQILKGYTERAAKAAGLNMVSADFLLYKGQYYLTDINPTPGLQNLPGGYAAVVPEIMRMLEEEAIAP